GNPDLAGCTEQSDLFPCSMVDRIVPELTEASGRKICRQLGLNDARPIDTEPFIQWVTEAAGSREGPDWALAGVTVTKDVQAYEVAKLRLLNGSHSAIAYLGYLAGYRSVSEAMADTDLSAFVDRLLNRELVTTVPETPGFNLADYARRLCDRFRNPGLLHKTAQIAMDGSQKIPQRLLDPIRARLARSEDSPCMAMAIAGWIRYVTGFDERGGRIDVKDPLVERLLALGRARNEPERLVDLALNIREVFGEDLGRDERFRRGLADSLRLLITRGARSAMKTLV
ncbi:MAG: mannitol dehydrogenase family protein, partial [Parvibaculaceae bacterium]